MAYAGHQSPVQRLAPSLVTLRARPPGCPAWPDRLRFSPRPHGFRPVCMAARHAAAAPSLGFFSPR